MHPNLPQPGSLALDYQTCRRSSPSPNPGHLESVILGEPGSDYDDRPGINQPNTYSHSAWSPRAYPAGATVSFNPGQWPMQPPLCQAPRNHNAYLPPGNGPGGDLAMRLASRNPWFPFSEDPGYLNDSPAFDLTGLRDTNGALYAMHGIVNLTHRHNIAFHPPHPTLPGAYIPSLPVEIPPASNSRTTSTSTYMSTILPTCQAGFGRASTGYIPEPCGAAGYTNAMHGPATRFENVGYTVPLVESSTAYFPTEFGAFVSSENGSSTEFAQWLEPIDQGNHLPHSYQRREDLSPLSGFGGEIQLSPELTATPSTSTPSSEASSPRKTNTRHKNTLRPVAPYPATCPTKRETRRQKPTRILTLTLIEAEAMVGPGIRKYWGTKGKKIPDDLPWKTRTAIEGGYSLKGSSQCIVCGSTAEHSSALYHARRHLNVNPYSCSYEACTSAFAQSSDLKNHKKSVHERHLARLSTPPTPSNDHLDILYHG